MNNGMDTEIQPDFSLVDYSRLLEHPVWISHEGVISAARAYLYKDPALESGVVDEAFTGTPFIIEEEKPRWTRIRTSYDYSGWIENENIKKRSEDSEISEETETHSNGIVTRTSADILKDPRYQSSVLTTLPAGSFIRLLPDEKDQWKRVRCVNGIIGWMRKEASVSLTVKDPPSEDTLRQNIVQTALSFLNTQYRWGGKTINGIDCSGLCSLSYMLNGYIIYRDSAFKEGPLKLCTQDDLSPGDLLYSPGHIMMYLGSDKILHSSGTLGKVSISSLNPGDEDYMPQFSEIHGCATLF